jgi:hypothetical protein
MSVTTTTTTTPYSILVIHLAKLLPSLSRYVLYFLDYSFADRDPQIRKSPQARAFFRKACKEENVPELELLQWIRTRWASLYKCLDRMLILRQVSFFFLSMFKSGLILIK